MTTMTSSNTHTPSSLDGISPSQEFLHKLHGTSLLHDASTLLRLSPSTYATSTTIFHHFYHRASLTKHDVWSTASACLLLATKIEEEPRSIRTILLTMAHIYRRRRLRMNDNMNISYGYADCEALLASTLTNDIEKENVLRSGKKTVMSVGGRAYTLWREQLISMEREILITFGFALYWVSDVHPHKYILYFCRVLEIDAKPSGKTTKKEIKKVDDGDDDGGDGKDDTVDTDDNQYDGVAQKAWNYCNDSCSLDLCVRFDPEVIACAAILMASAHHNINLPLLPHPWWEVFIGPNRGQDLSVICNAILALNDETNIDIRRSKFAFIPSLMKGMAFNDPDSDLWSLFDE